MKPRTIGVRLVGGLGNQLFIWATAFVISKKNEFELSLDASRCGQWGCELASFGIEIDIEPPLPSGILPGYSNRNGVLNFFRLIRKKYRNLRISKNYWERSSQFDSSVFFIKPGRILCGYFQSYKYFAGFENDIREHLRHNFRGSSEYANLLNQMSTSDWLAIHVRRQDYILLKQTFGLTTEKYYVDAIQRVDDEFPSWATRRG